MDMDINMDIEMGIEMEEEMVTLQELFVFRQVGLASAGRTYGEFDAPGLTSHYDTRFRAAGITMPPEL